MLSQAIQVVPSKFRKEEFRLTLIGILLVLYQIRKRDMDENHNSLLYPDYNLEDYYSKIASNYHDKLTLIFGKWSKLTQILSAMSIFNFDIILDKKFRYDSLSSSGNSVLYNSMRSIFQDCKNLLSDLQVSGILEMINIVGKNYLTVDSEYKKARKIIWKKLRPVYELWIKLTFVLVEKADDYESIKQKLNKYEELDSENMARIISLYSMEIMDKSLENEITTLYYMNLNASYKFQVMPSHYLNKVAAGTYYGIKDTPLLKLSSLLQADAEIRNVIETMFQDGVNYHSKLARVIEDSKANLGVL